MAENSEYFRVYDSYSIKFYGNFPCLIMNQRGEYAIGEQIYDCGATNVYYDITTEEHDNIQDHVQAVGSATPGEESKIKDEIVITQEPEEAIILLFDTSGSMSSVYVDELQRIQAAKTFFNAFADRAIAYKLKLAISLIIFNDKIQTVCQFTERFRSFKSHVELCNPNSSTRLYDAIICATEQLTKLAEKYPNILKRVICFSDGEDVGSKKTEYDATLSLKNAHITLDSILVGTKNNILKAISLATGGYSYYFSNISDGMQLFESETFLRAAIRYLCF